MDNRLFLAMIENACARHDVVLSVFSDGWLLQLQQGTQIHRIVGSNFDLNSQAAAAIARDKAATTALLNANNIAHIPHTVIRSSDMHTPKIDYLTELLNKGDVVMKPLEGGKGDYVVRVSDSASAKKLIDSTLPMAWAASPYVDIDREIRLVVVDGQVRLAYSKVQPVLINGLKFFNLSKGATAEPLNVGDVPKDIELSALASMQALGLRMAAVDIVIMSNGQQAVLEVNASFSVMRYAQTNKATYNEVALFYERLVADMLTT